jgi:AcrR family transcriptional regulator
VLVSGDFVIYGGHVAKARGDHADRRGLPRGPQALPREEVAAHQRQRLFDAMVQAINEHGFAATTISDLVGRAGVSRRSFYEHFANKDECLLGAFDASAQRLTSRLFEAYGAAQGWEEQVEAVTHALLQATLERRDAARLVCVDVGAAGPAGVQRWARSAARFERFLDAVFQQAPGPGTIPAPVAKAYVGALRKILYSRVSSGLTDRALRAELSTLAPELARWISGYYPSPPGVAIRPRPIRPRQFTGGRAPGTLAPPSRASPRGLPPGERSLPKGFVAHNQRERIFDAIANLTAAKGYPAVGLEEIAAEAAVSLQTFYRHFESKADAFMATYEVGHAKTVAIMWEAFASRSEWTDGVRAGMQALFEFLAAEPSYAHMVSVDILIAFPHMTERLDQASSSYAELLEVGLNGAGDPPSIVSEAIVGGVFELLHDYVLRGRTRRLPELTDHATYIALTPFIGSEAAAETIASGKRR